MEKNKLKKVNRSYLKKVFTVKSVFYPIMYILVKTGLPDLAEAGINRMIKIFGINKNVHYFFKYRDFGKWFANDFRDIKNNKPEILFPMMAGVNSNFTLLNLLLSRYFRDYENFNPVFYICNSAFEICTKDGMLKSREKYPWFCHECWNGYKFIESRTGIETIRMKNMFPDSTVIADTEQEKIEGIKNIKGCFEYEYDGIQIGKYVRKSVLRYFLLGSLPETDNVIRIYKTFLLSALKYNLAFSRVLNERSGIKYVILNNGSLSFEAIARIHCEKRGISYLTYETYIGNNSLIYKKNGPVMDLNWVREYNFFKQNFVLDDQIKKQVKEFFENLKKGVGMYAVLNQNHKSDKLAAIDRYACLFTNLNYDTAVIDKNYLFGSMEEWIISVIEYWGKSNLGITLIIRIHPGEIKLVTASKEFLGERIRKACENNEQIIVFDSDDKINSYELIKKMEYGLIYSSTIGLEIAWAGKPCIVAGLPWFRDKPFVIYPDSAANYFKNLESLNKREMRFNPDLDELYRTIYFVYFNRIKRLNGIKMYTPKEEPNTVFDNPEDMVRENMTFLKEFRDELFSRDL